METNINESIFMALKVSEESGVPVLLMGNPGCGKTTSVEYYAKVNNMKMVLLRGSQSDAESILGYEANEGEYSEWSGVKIKKASKICPKWYDEICKNHDDGIRTLLFLDEITTTNSFVQAALFQVIFGKSIDNGYDIPDDTFIVAAGNYSGNLSSEFNLEPPLMNRFCIFNVTVGKDDVKSFLSKYQGRQDTESKLKIFQKKCSIIDSITESFKDKVSSYIESNLASFTESLIRDGKFNPNVTEMSDIYRDSDSTLPGFLTLRSLNYYRDISICMYLQYGLNGIRSDVFYKMTTGLVGISLSSNKSDSHNEVEKHSVSNDYYEFVKKLTEYLDRYRIPSIEKYESKINSILNKYKNSSDPKISSSDSISLNEILGQFMTDTDTSSVDKPIDEKILLDLIDKIILTSKSLLRDYQPEINLQCSDPSKKDTSKFDINKISGELQLYNNLINLYKSVSKVIIEKKGYSEDIKSRINGEFKDILGKNGYRLNFIKTNLENKIFSHPLSNLVKIECL